MYRKAGANIGNNKFDLFSFVKGIVQFVFSSLYVDIKSLVLLS